MRIPLIDAHNHLQDQRLAAGLPECLDQCRSVGVRLMVVNGSCPADWPEVAQLFHDQPDLVLPSFGVHPWYVSELGSGWRPALEGYWDAGSSAVGEIGLDRWKPGLPYAGQEEVFCWQLGEAARRNVPCSIHCLRAWGRLLELLEKSARPACGFLLHSFGGPAELVKRLADLGAYFSFPGYYAHPRKVRQRETFLRIPPDRFLIETDAPDQPLPSDRDRYGLVDQGTGKAINHPANLVAVYEAAAELLGESVTNLASRVRVNFDRLFGGLLSRRARDLGRVEQEGRGK